MVGRVTDRVVDGLCLVAGRRLVVRASRRMLRRACLDGANDPGTNGELALQRWVLAASPAGTPLTVLDIGANVGAWSRALVARARRAGRGDDLRLHAFEPDADAYAALVAGLPGSARTNRVAVSATAGVATLHRARPAAGVNSLHPWPGADSPTPVESTTVDEYLAGLDTGHVDLMKIDTEGHDHAVLLGAERSLRQQRIAVAQFEYNHRWVYSRHFLKDAFDLLGPLGYRIGKLTPRGMESYPDWDPDLETFVEGNYLACTDEAARWLPQVRWWKAAALR